MAKRTSSVSGVVIGSIALTFTVAITVGWNIIFPFYFDAVFTTEDSTGSKVGLWILMALGDVFLVLVILAITFFLVNTIKRTKHIRRQLAFIDNITHELKTPLTSLSLSIDTFQRREIDDDMRKQIIKRMDQDIQRLTHFIQHVIETNRLEHGERILRSEKCDVKEIVDTCCSRIRERYELEQEQLTLKFDEENILIMADPVGLESVVLNLLDNAVKYSQDDIHVHCVVSSHPEEHRITVSDHGMGLSPRDLRQVFDRFSRVSQQSHISGSGLGLFIVKQLLKGMGMRIDAKSEGEDQGSQFCIHIPRKLDAEL